MLTLLETKLHLRVDLDDDDDLIESLIAAATAIIASHLDNPAIVLNTNAPAAVKSAALLLVADLYENRSAQVEKPLHNNLTFDRLLNPYRVMSA